MRQSAILLTADAIAGFSQSTRDELRAHFFGTSSGVREPASPAAMLDDLANDGGEQGLDNVDELTPLGGRQITEFMRNVSPRTRELLKAFADTSDGVLPMRDVKRIGNYDTWQQTRGFASGITKRVRTITGDDEASFYGWRGADDADDGAFFLHPTTHQSLKRFFGV